MKVFAYTYTDPLLESIPEPEIWGWEVDRVYQDIGNRQQLKQLIKDCQINRPHFLLIRKFTELGDTVEEISSKLKEIESWGSRIIATEETEFSLNSEPLKSDILQLLKAIQNEHRSRRIRQGHARNRLQAKPPPGKAPYGYQRGKNSYVVDKRTAPVVKDFFEQFLLFGSLRGAVRYLEKKYNKKVSVSTGHRWLTNPVYRGDTAFKDGETLLDTHVPIISREEAAQVDRLLRRNRRLPPRTASAPRSLAGLVRCAECQSPMSVSRVRPYRQEKEYMYLRPTNCPLQPKCKSLAYQTVLEETIKTICQDLQKAIASLQMPDMDRFKVGITSAIARQQDILAQIPTLTATGILDSETAQLRAYKLRTEIAQLQARLAELPPVNLRSVAEAISLPQFWLDLSESERRFYLREFIRQIEIIRDRNQGWQLRLIFIF